MKPGYVTHEPMLFPCLAICCCVRDVLLQEQSLVLTAVLDRAATEQPRNTRPKICGAFGATANHSQTTALRWSSTCWPYKRSKRNRPATLCQHTHIHPYKLYKRAQAQACRATVPCAARCAVLVGCLQRAAHNILSMSPETVQPYDTHAVAPCTHTQPGQQQRARAQ